MLLACKSDSVGCLEYLVDDGKQSLYLYVVYC